MGGALPEDPWEELIHQGDVFEEAVAATPAILAALEQGTDDDANWLYLLAALCVGRPDERAERIRVEARAGAQLYRRLLVSDDAETRAGAVAALAAAGAAEGEDRERLAALAADDVAALVRAHAALALGLEPGRESDLEQLLADPDEAVAHAAALALARVGRRDERVVLVLARALVDGADSPTERPPWDHLYPDWSEELTELGADARPALPLLLDGLDRAEPWLVAELARVALELGGRDEEIRRDVARRLLARDDDVWARADLEVTLREQRLPDTRDALRELLAD